MQQKFSMFFSVALVLGICYLWPWAIRQKVNRLELEAKAKKAEEKKAAQHPEALPVNEVVSRPQKRSVQLLFPVQGKGLQDIISFFGDAREGGNRRHEGVDIGAARGTAVLAVADGTVAKVKNGGSGGKQIWLLLDNGWEVYYAHLHAQLVLEGNTVKAGDLIGTVGNTGNAQAAGPHLHFCLYPSRDKPVNPLLYLPGQLALP